MTQHNSTAQHEKSPDNIDSRLRPTLMFLLGMFAFTGGLLSLIGWFAGIYRLTDWSDTGISMKANTAVAALASGVGLMLNALWPKARRTIGIVGVFVALIGGLTLCEHLIGWDLGIDNVLIEETPGARATSSPGRMGPPASTSFTFIGISLLLIAIGGRARKIVVVLAIAVMAISMLSLTGYLYGAEPIYSIPRLTGISVQAAAIIFATGLGLFASIPEHYPLRLLLQRNAAGMLARQVLPIAILLPLIVGWIRVLGQDLNLYDTAFGTAIRTVAEVALLFGLLWWAIAKVEVYETALRDSEHRVTETLASITDGVVTLDSNWRYVFFNAEALRLLGKSSSDLMGRCVWEIFPEFVGGTAHEAVLRTATSKTAVEFECFYPAMQRWFSNKAYATADGGVAIYFQDITERRKVEAELAVKERQLQHVTDNAAVLVAQCSRDLRYQFVNKTCADFLGRSIEDIVGKPIAEVLGHDAFETIRPYVDKVLSGARVEFENEIPSSDSGPRWMRVVYVPDRDEQGTVCGWIAAITDITDRKDAEEALRRADARKDEFLATLAHELRNPMATLTNSLELLNLMENENPVAAKALLMMKRQMAHMVRLVDDLLDLSRISRGKIELKKQRLELSAVIDQAVEMTQSLIRDGDQQITVELSTDTIYLDADPARLAQAFGNLLNNACRYSHRGGQISVRAERQGSDVVVSVKDDGIGIPAGKLEEIFQMFSQVDRALERTAGGLGIGLHLVRQLVEMHEGSVIARSDGPGSGSEFIVRLPIAAGNTAVQHTTATLAMGDSASYRILVVDDNLDSANTLAMLLKSNGHEVQTAYDGAEAVEQAIAYQPDVILLDIGLPKINGYDACRAIRQKCHEKAILIVAVTGWGQEDDRRKSKDAGFDAHLIKPVDHADFVKLLRKWQASRSMTPA